MKIALFITFSIITINLSSQSIIDISNLKSVSLFEKSFSDGLYGINVDSIIKFVSSAECDILDWEKVFATKIISPRDISVETSYLVSCQLIIVG